MNCWVSLGCNLQLLSLSHFYPFGKPMGIGFFGQPTQVHFLMFSLITYISVSNSYNCRGPCDLGVQLSSPTCQGLVSWNSLALLTPCSEERDMWVRPFSLILYHFFKSSHASIKTHRGVCMVRFPILTVTNLLVSVR